MHGVPKPAAAVQGSASGGVWTLAPNKGVRGLFFGGGGSSPLQCLVPAGQNEGPCSSITVSLSEVTIVGLQSVTVQQRDIAEAADEIAKEIHERMYTIGEALDCSRRYFLVG